MKKHISPELEKAATDFATEYLVGGNRTELMHKAFLMGALWREEQTAQPIKNGDLVHYTPDPIEAEVVSEVLEFNGEPNVYIRTASFTHTVPVKNLVKI